MTIDFNIIYKGLVILTIEDEKIIGARKYDYDGTDRVIPYLDLEYPANNGYHLDSIRDVSARELMHEGPRTFWTFNTEREAFVQKLWMLKNLREFFVDFQQKQKIAFSSDIPDLINDAFLNRKLQNPEYFL